MRRHTHPGSFSKKMIGGIISITTSVIGGFLSSVGINLYDIMKLEISSRLNNSLNIPQAVFLIVGIAGLILIVSDLRGRRKKRNKRKN